MDEKTWGDVKIIMEKVKPFIALAILIFIVISTVQLINYNSLQKEIKTTCGYSPGEDVYCVCDKNLVSLLPTANNPYKKDSFDGLNVSEKDLGN